MAYVNGLKDSCYPYEVCNDSKLIKNYDVVLIFNIFIGMQMNNVSTKKVTDNLVYSWIFMGCA